MSEFAWILVGVGSAIGISVFVYILQVCVKLFNNKNKIKKTLVQIKGQVDVKHDLLKEYVEINRDSIVEEKRVSINEKLNAYNSQDDKDIEILKEFNEVYVDYMRSFDDSLLNKQCDESEEKINYIKEYYNELVSFHNQYRATGINVVFAKAFSISDEKIY